MKKLLTALTFCYATSHGFAQKIRFDQLNVSDGISSNSVYTIFQDSRGFMWFGTLDGLNRFNGYDIKVYKHDKLDPHSLSNNRITNIFEDRHRNLWLYDEYTSILNKLHLPTQKFSSYYLNQVAGSDLEVLDTIYENAQGIFLQSKLGPELQYIAEKDSFIVPPQTNDNPEPGKAIKGYEDIIRQFEKFLKETGNPFDAGTIRLKEILKDSQGRFWIATQYGGLYTASADGEEYKFTSHFATDDPLMKINSEEIYDIFEDHSGVIWIGTKNKGVYRYTPDKYKFDLIDQVKIEGSLTAIGTVRAITQDKEKNIWVGTNDMGLLKIGQQGARLFKPEADNPQAIGHRFVRCLWLAEGGALWVGHYDGFSVYHPSSNTFAQYTITKDTTNDARIYDFKQGRENVIWMAAWDMICRYDSGTNEVKTVFSSPDKSGLVIENIRELLLDNMGDLWIVVSEKGMALYNKNTNRFTIYRSDPDDASSLPTNNIFHIHEDKSHRLWLATADGLCLFDLTTEKFRTYTTNDGLPSNLIYGILEDAAGNLWLSTTNGISKFNPKKKKFRNYDLSDGLQSNEFTENAFFQNKEGEMFFGGVNGLSIFHPEKVPDNSTPPIVALTGMKVFEKTLSEVDLIPEETLTLKMKHGEEIQLTHEQRSMRFEFVGLHYVSPLKNIYAYKLEGFDETWIHTDARIRFANYTNLEPGKYTFKVKAANSDGFWSNDTIALHISIAPPFYKTLWFSVLSVTLIGGLGVLAYRKRIGDIKKKQSLKAMQLESELNFLKSQVNPHFLFNTLNNIYALCQVNSSKAAPMVGKISEMMRYMLYDCNADRVLLRKEIEYLKNYIDLIRLKNPRKLNVAFDIAGKLNNQKIAPLLLINFLENSFKHGDAHRNENGFVKIKIEVNEERVIFKLANSFRERTVDASSSIGIGLENTKQRLALLYKDRHSLRIGKNNGIFEVELTLILE